MRKKILVTLICIIFLTLTGCSKRNVEIEDTLEITMMQELFQNPADLDGNHLIEKIEENTKTKLSVNFIPTLSYVDRTNALLATNKLPMVISANSTVLSSAAVISGLKNERFWSLDEYIKDYPNLFHFIGEDVWDSSRIEGKIYGIPRLRIKPRNTGFYRKDWAEALGIKEPETLEELYDMLYQFTYNDPDGNGFDDTYGLVISWSSWSNRGWNGIQTLTTYLGGPNGWRYENGTMIPDFSTKEYMQMLQFYNRLYKEGILATEFPMLNSEQRVDLFEAGKAGMTFGVIDDVAGIQKGMEKMNDKAALKLLPVLTFEGKQYTNSISGYNGLILFNKSGDDRIRNEEELKKILAFYDYLCTNEGQELLIYGIEGEHFIRETDGTKRMLYSNSGNLLLIDALGDIGQIFPLPEYVSRDEKTTLETTVKEEIAIRQDYLVFDDSMSLVSLTYNENKSYLDKIIMDASIRFIMGEFQEEDYWAAYNSWLFEGGTKVIEEYTQEYETYKLER